MVLKLRLLLIKLLLGNRGLIANVEIDGRSAMTREGRFLFIGGRDLWINNNGLELMNVENSDGYEIEPFEFTTRTRFFWPKKHDYMRSELVEKYGSEDVKKDWLFDENRFKTNTESMG